MNIALAYSGQPRNIEKTWNNHKKYLIEPLKEQGFIIDIFCHFWFDKNDVGKDYIEGSYLIGKTKDSTDFIKKIVNPERLSFEKPNKFSSTSLIPDKRFPHPIDRTLSMFQSWYRVSNQLEEHEKSNNFKYDLVFRLRSDLVFNKKFPDIKNFDLNKLYVIDKFVHLNYGVDDTFAFSNSNNIKSYLKLSENLDKVVELGAAINPETLLGFYLHNFLKIRVEKVQLDIKLFRVSYLKFSKFKSIGNFIIFLNNNFLYIKFKIREVIK